MLAATARKRKVKPKVSCLVPFPFPGLMTWQPQTLFGWSQEISAVEIQENAKERDAWMNNLVCLVNLWLRSVGVMGWSGRLG